MTRRLAYNTSPGAVIPTGKLFIAHRQQATVYVYTDVVGGETQIQTITTGISAPYCIYHDATHNKIWVGNLGNTNLVVINPTTYALTNVSLSPYANHCSARKITGNSNYVFAVGPQNSNRTYIYVVSTTTNALVGILSYNNGSGVARDISADSSGNLYVIGGFNVAQKFSAANIATAIASFPTPSTASTWITPIGSTPLGFHVVCYDAVDNQVWGGDYHGQAIYQLNGSTGALINSKSLSGGVILNGAVYLNGFVWVGTETGTVYQINPSTFPATGSVVSFSSGSPSSYDPCVDALNGTLLVNSRGNGNIKRVSPTASPSVLSTITPPGSLGTVTAAVSTS